MGRLKDLVSKVKEEVAPIATVVRGEMAQQMEKVVDRVLSPPPRATAAGAAARNVKDEWAFNPSNGASAGQATTATANGASNGAGAHSHAEATNGVSNGASVQAAAPGTTHGTDAAATNGATAGASSNASNGASNGATAAPVGGGSGQGESAVASSTAPAAAPAVRINAQPSPTDPATCKFTVEIPVFEERLIRIKSREVAELCSPLAQKLFEIPQVGMVTFSGNIINVSKKGSDPWQAVARLVGPAIRAHIASGLPALSQEPPIEETGGKVDNAELRDRVQGVIDTLINPGVASHGGFVTLNGVEDDIAYITMGGGCQGCGMADVTLRQGIVATIRAQVPEIAQVLDATDHEGGLNPYYEQAK